MQVTLKEVQDAYDQLLEAYTEQEEAYNKLQGAFEKQKTDLDTAQKDKKKLDELKGKVRVAVDKHKVSFSLYPSLCGLV